MSVSRSSARWIVGIAATVLLGATVVVVGFLPRDGPEYRGGHDVPDGQAPPLPLEAPAEATLFREVLSVSDATLKDGVWYVLDQTGDQVHRLDPVAGLLGSFGRRGPGPGEFDLPQAIVVQGDSIVVLDGRKLRFFDAEGTHIADRTVDVEAVCRLNDAVSLSHGLVLMVRCSEGASVGYYAVLEAPDGSTVRLASHTSDRGDPITGAVVLGRHPRGFLFGLPYETCLGLFDPGGTQLGDVCHEWIERLPLPPVPEETAEEMASIRQEARQLGISLTWPEHLPPFTRLSIMGRDRIVYHAPAPGYDLAERLVTRSADGHQITIPVPPASVQHVAGERALAAWEDIEGMRILFKPVG